MQDDQDRLPYPALIDDIEVYAASGGTYALLTTHADDPIRVVDLTDPAAPEIVAEIRSGSRLLQQEGISAISMKAYAASGGTYAMLADTAGNLVRVVNITDPAAPEIVAEITGGSGDFYALSDPADVETVSRSGTVYALVASGKYGSVQVLNITNPREPTPVAEIWDGSGEMEIFGSSGRTYALLMSGSSVHIINVTDPASASTISGARSTEEHARFRAPAGAGIFSASGNIHAIIPEDFGSRIYIADITDAGAPGPLHAVDVEPHRFFPVFSNPTDIEEFYAYGRPYALITGYSRFDAGGGTVEVMDVTSPQSAVYASTIVNGQDGFGTLGTPTDAEVFGASGRTYALIVDYADSGGGIHIVDITDPDSPAPVATVRGGQGILDARDGPVEAEIFASGGATYALLSNADGSTLQVISLTAEGAPP